MSRDLLTTATETARDRENAKNGKARKDAKTALKGLKPQSAGATAEALPGAADERGYDLKESS